MTTITPTGKPRRTIPKHILRRRRRYYKSVKGSLKRMIEERDGEIVCASCGTREHLELHHIMPLALGGDNDISNLMPLCHDHHVAIHRNKDDLKE